MILTPEDLSAIEKAFGPEKAASIINALEKLEREQRVEIKKDLLIELATKANLAELRGLVKSDVEELRQLTTNNLPGRGVLSFRHGFGRNPAPRKNGIPA